MDQGEIFGFKINRWLNGNGQQSWRPSGVETMIYDSLSCQQTPSTEQTEQTEAGHRGREMLSIIDKELNPEPI